MWSNFCSRILRIMILVTDIPTRCFLPFIALKAKVWCNYWLGIIPSTVSPSPIWSIMATFIRPRYICDIKPAFSRLRPIWEINVIFIGNWSSFIWGIIVIVKELMLLDQFCKWINLVLDLFDLFILLWYLLFLRTDVFRHFFHECCMM